jgi:hypothetical protein
MVEASNQQQERNQGEFAYHIVAYLLKQELWSQRKTAIAR